VTGASEGIGRDLAIGLASVGANVVVCSRNEQKLKDVVSKIVADGGKAEFFVTDITQKEDLINLKAFMLDRYGKLDILINSAGYTVTKMAWNISETEVDLMVDTGLKGLFYCCQVLGSLMMKNNYGKIINLSSTFSQSLVPGRSVYAAVKAAVSHLTEALAVEWAIHGIRVNALAPTATITPSRAQTLQGDILKYLLSRIPLGRLAEADDLICATIFLASAASDFITGQTLFVDGGWVANG
jgi:NAD(P)-dependent dehydrogenase (short-subunit alcohol dehydrogenase family)